MKSKLIIALLSFAVVNIQRSHAVPSADAVLDTSIKEEVRRKSTSFINFADLQESYQKAEYGKIVELYNKKAIRRKDENAMLVVAMALRNEGKLNESMAILQNISKSKNLSLQERATIEIASVYYLKKDNKTALKICDQVLRSSKNNKIKRYAKDLKDVIVSGKNIFNTRKKKIFYGSLGLNYLHDSNPNLSTADSQIYLYGIAIDNTKPPESDTGVNVNGNVGYNYDLTQNTKIYGNVAGDFTGYKQYRERDMLFLSAFQGISYQHNKSTYGLMASYNNMFIGIDSMNKSDNYYMAMYGITPSYTYDFGFLKSQTSYRYIKKDSKGFPDKTSNMNLMTQNFYSFITPITMVNIGGGGGFERTTNSIYDNNISTANLLVRQFAPYNIPVYIDFTYNVNWSRYQEIDPSFRDARRDKYSMTKTSIHYVHNGRLDFNASYTTGKNDSNVGLYRFKRRQIMAGISLLF